MTGLDPSAYTSPHTCDPADLIVAAEGTDARERLHAFLAALSPNWHSDAACRGEPVSIFFPGRGEPTDLAPQFCGRCPVRQQCLDEAIADPGLDHGFRGGMSAKARKAHRRAADARTKRRPARAD